MCLGDYNEILSDNDNKGVMTELDGRWIIFGKRLVIAGFRSSLFQGTRLRMTMGGKVRITSNAGLIGSL